MIILSFSVINYDKAHVNIHCHSWCICRHILGCFLTAKKKEEKKKEKTESRKCIVIVFTKICTDTLYFRIHVFTLKCLEIRPM